jgi:hypothetical protein
MRAHERERESASERDSKAIRSESFVVDHHSIAHCNEREVVQVFEFMVDHTSDRGGMQYVPLDWHRALQYKLLGFSV